MVRKQNEEQDKQEAADAVDGNVDQIRQILFGGQMRNYEARFAKLENRLASTIEELSDSVNQRIDVLDAFAKEALKKLNDDLAADKAARASDNDASAKEFASQAERVETRFAEVEGQLQTEMRELRAALQDQSHELLATIQESGEQLSAGWQAEASNLEQHKLGRKDLAELLSDVSSRITNAAKSSKS